MDSCGSRMLHVGLLWITDAACGSPVDLYWQLVRWSFIAFLPAFLPGEACGEACGEGPGEFFRLIFALFFCLVMQITTKKTQFPICIFFFNGFILGVHGSCHSFLLCLNPPIHKDASYMYLCALGRD